MESYKENSDYIDLCKIENELSKLESCSHWKEIRALDYEQFKILSKYYDKYCEFVRKTYRDIVKKYGNIVDENEFLTKMQVVENYDKSENNTFQFFYNDLNLYDGTFIDPYIEFSTVCNSHTCYIVLSIELLFDEHAIEKKIYDTIYQIFNKYDDKLCSIQKELNLLNQRFQEIICKKHLCLNYIKENTYE